MRRHKLKAEKMYVCCLSSEIHEITYQYTKTHREGKNLKVVYEISFKRKQLKT